VVTEEAALSSDDSEGRIISSSDNAEALLEAQEQNLAWPKRTRATS
jgi:hypothetical protein